MSKQGKISLIVFVIGIVGLGVTMGVIIGSGHFASKDNEEVLVLSDDIKGFELSLDKGSVQLEEADEIKVVSQLNLWADEDIKVGDVALISSRDGVITIMEQAPQNKFFGMFPQPYELKITIHAPRSVIDDIDWRQAK